jgi:alginate O-acetyltransferase complex protein AlgI
VQICSLEFLLACCGIVILLHVLPSLWLRQLSFGIVNAAFLVPLVPNWESWAWLAGFVCLTYLALVVVRARPNPWFVAVAIIVIVALFLYVKQYSFLPYVSVELWWIAWQEHLAVNVIGLSYMLFKFIHMLVDESQGQLAPFTLWSYLNYQLAFFTLFAGPIQRYNDFRQGWQEMDLRWSDAGENWDAWRRILFGVIKMRVLGSLAQSAFDDAYGHLVTGGTEYLLYFAIYFYAYPVQLYFNFAGYTDVAIGSAQLLGFKLPENFNRPYLARNVLDFWDRWHMSLTAWIRAYVFMTSYKAAATRWPRWSRYWGYALSFLALLVVGLWHGTTSGFIAFGALNGLGAAVNRAYGDGLRKYLGRPRFQRYEQSRFIRVVAVVTTFHYVCFCLLFFSSLEAGVAWGMVVRVAGELRQHRALITVAVWLVAFFLAALAASWLTTGIQTGGLSRRVASRVANWNAGSVGWSKFVVYSQVVLVVLIFCFDWAARNQPPPVVYMRF